MVFPSSAGRLPCSITTTSPPELRVSTGRKTSGMRSGSGCTWKMRAAMVAPQRSGRAPLTVGDPEERRKSAAHAGEGRRATPGGLVRRYLSCIRYREILVLQGSPPFGGAFAMGEVIAGRLGALLVFATARVLL